MRKSHGRGVARHVIAEPLESRQLLTMIYVDAAAAPGIGNDGTSWAKAYPYLDG